MSHDEPLTHRLSRVVTDEAAALAWCRDNAPDAWGGAPIRTREPGPLVRAGLAHPLLGGSMKIEISHNGTTYSGEINRITGTTFGAEGHGITTAYLHCEGDGTGVSVGGFCLDQSSGPPDHVRVGTAYGLDHLLRIMETVGVSSWEALSGERVVVLFPDDDHWGQRAVGIAGLLNGKVLIFEEHAAEWREAGAS